MWESVRARVLLVLDRGRYSGRGGLTRTAAVLLDEGRRRKRRASHDQTGIITDAIAVGTIDHAHLLGCTDKVLLHGGASTAAVGLLQLGKLRLELLGNVTAGLEVVELHVDDGTVDPLETRRKADGALDTIAGVGGVPAMDAAKTDLSNGDGPLTARSRSLDVGLGGAEYFNVLTNDAQSLRQRDTIVGHGKKEDTFGSTELPCVRVDSEPAVAAEVGMMVLMRGAHHVGSRRISPGVIHRTRNSVHGRIRRRMRTVMRVPVRSGARRGVFLSPATAGRRQVAHLIATFHAVPVPMRRGEAGRPAGSPRVGLLVLLRSGLAVVATGRVELAAHTHSTVETLAERRRRRAKGTLILERLVLVGTVGTTGTCSGVGLVELHHRSRTQRDGILPRAAAHTLRAGRGATGASIGTAATGRGAAVGIPTIEADLNVAGRVGTADEGSSRRGLQDLRVLTRHTEGHAGGQTDAGTGDGTAEGVAPRSEGEGRRQSRGILGGTGGQSALLLGIRTVWGCEAVASLGGSSVALPLLVAISSSFSGG